MPLEAVHGNVSRNPLSIVVRQNLHAASRDRPYRRRNSDDVLAAWNPFPPDYQITWLENCLYSSGV